MVSTWGMVGIGVAVVVLVGAVVGILWLFGQVGGGSPLFNGTGTGTGSGAGTGNLSSGSNDPQRYATAARIDKPDGWTFVGVAIPKANPKEGYPLEKKPAGNGQYLYRISESTYGLTKPLNEGKPVNELLDEQDYTVAGQPPVDVHLEIFEKSKAPTGATWTSVGKVQLIDNARHTYTLQTTAGNYYRLLDPANNDTVDIILAAADRPLRNGEVLNLTTGIGTVLHFNIMLD